MPHNSRRPADGINYRDNLERWPWRFFIISFALLSGLMFAWSLASPLGSSPDEPAHIIRAAAVVRGEVIGSTDTGRSYATVEVPAYIAYTSKLPCYFGDLTKSAACSSTLKKGLDREVISATSAASNSPVYYALVGAPTLILSGDSALYAMRVVSLLLVAVMLAALLTTLKVIRSSAWTFAGALVGITPTALFLGGTVNPNTAEMAAAGLVLVTLLILLRRNLSRRAFWSHSAILVGGVVILTGTRSISLLWLLLVALAALALTGRERLVEMAKQRRMWVVVGVVGLASIGALAWFTRPLPPGPLTGVPPRDGVTTVRVAAVMVQRTFDYWTGWIGYFGWLDQPSPSFVYIVWYGFIGILLVGGIFAGRGVARVVCAFLALASFVVPVVVQSALYESQGWMWQGRYLLAVDLCMLIVGGMALGAATRGSVSPVLARGLRAGVVLMALAQFAGFFETLRRYVVGAEPVWSMLNRAQWQPPLSWIGVTLFYALVLALTVRFIWRQTRPETPSLPPINPDDRSKTDARSIASAS